MVLNPDGPLLVSGDAALAAGWCDQARQGVGQGEFLLVLAATATAAVAGISAAGSTPESRRFTAAADGELVVLGPGAPRPHALPPLPAGVSPALISWVVLEQLRLDRRVVNAGVEVAPAVAHGQVPGCQPAACLSTGRALPLQQVQNLLRWGENFGRAWVRRQPGALLVVGECVAGGTSTAAAVLQGLGVDGTGLVSGSLRQPPHRLRQQLVTQGRQRSGRPATVPELAAAVGDPMQPLVAGVILGCGGAAPLLLAGGSQMAAVLAMAMAMARSRGQPLTPLLRTTAVGTTRWVAREPGSNLALLLERVHGQLQLPQAPLAMASTLDFSPCTHPALRDYEAGYVKEGVGAGGLAIAAGLAGLSNSRLARLCDQAMDQLEGRSES
ncbi:MAG: TIGR00303 family protein [Synechococcus sp. SB0668_bin_15]|nr:TIGR00303 family protein [Synechococcus sp. SB0668_bin_15]MYC48752.1 TIGR00303 family protein [Synechococcus sp. SB0662_bin_14]